jgi:hypothetical protein
MRCSHVDMRGCVGSVHNNWISVRNVGRRSLEGQEFIGVEMDDAGVIIYHVAYNYGVS